MEEARTAVSRQDFTAARRWMGEARDAGVDAAGTAALERDIVAAQSSNARQPSDNVVTASQLSQTRYVKPEYPAGAQQRGTGGWVDVTFTVRVDGTVTDVGVTGAEPAGIFEQAAMSAVRRWRYDPVKKDGRAIEQRARVRIRFSVE